MNKFTGLMMAGLMGLTPMSVALADNHGAKDADQEIEKEIEEIIEKEMGEDGKVEIIKIRKYKTKDGDEVIMHEERMRGDKMPRGEMRKKMKKRMEAMRAKRQEMADKRFAEQDADGNGTISRAEFAAHRNARFAEHDTDGDGSISAEEAKAHAKSVRAKAGERMKERVEEAKRAGEGEHVMKMRIKERAHKPRHHFRQMDVNGDKAVSAEEFAVVGDHMFNRMDANGDGEVTRTEALFVERQMMGKNKMHHRSKSRHGRKPHAKNSQHHN